VCSSDLIGLEVKGAKFEGDKLKIRFEGEEERPGPK
jgi:hypothetical protein